MLPAAIRTPLADLAGENAREQQKAQEQKLNFRRSI